MEKIAVRICLKEFWDSTIILPKATRQKRGLKDNERETHYRAHAMPRNPGGLFHSMEVKNG
jgi:hypothetical protein